MFMKIFLKIKRDNQINLSITRKGNVVGRTKWKENNSLSRILLFKIDQILRRRRIRLDKISGFEIISDVPEKWTSCRIAEITLKSLVLAKKNPL